jgi:hypothetical protein
MYGDNSITTTLFLKVGKGSEQPLPQSPFLEVLSWPLSRWEDPHCQQTEAEKTFGSSCQPSGDHIITGVNKSVRMW